MTDLNQQKIIFIGGGNMASAILAGLINSNVPASNVYVVDYNQEKLNYLEKTYAINTSSDFEQLTNTVKDNNCIFVLAVKPKDIVKVCKQINLYLNTRHIVISVAAGVTCGKMSQHLTNCKTIIRAMPNTPAHIGQGMTILFGASSLEKNILAEELFAATGQTLWVKTEEEINTTMAISGCGPAYIFLLCESLMQAAKDLGIENDTAKQLVTATVSGACEFYKQSDKSAAQLRSEVTSPNGTTEAAINVINPESSLQLYSKALAAAVKKAKLIEQSI